MSDYPRPVLEPAYTGPFLPDRIVGALRIVTGLLSCATYFFRFYGLWSRQAAYASIFAWAPPLGTHLTGQIAGVFHVVFVGIGVWYGRGWAFAYALLTCLAALAQSLIVPPTTAAYSLLMLLVYLPTCLYCGLRLIGRLGPPTGGLELRQGISPF